MELVFELLLTIKHHAIPDLSRTKVARQHPLLSNVPARVLTNPLHQSGLTDQSRQLANELISGTINQASLTV